MYLRKFAAIASTMLALTLLSGCTSAAPKPAETKAAASCFPGVPKVAAEVKAGSTLTVNGPGSDGCLVKLTQANKQVTLTLTGNKQEILASTSVKASATGKYTAKLQVPSTYSGKASVRLDSGFLFQCADTASCAAPVKTVNVTSTR